MKKMAIVFVKGLEEDPAVLVRLSAKAALGAYNKTVGLFSKKTDFDLVTAQVIDIQSLMSAFYAVDKNGVNHFLATNDPKDPDPRQTVLVVGPEESDKLNKMSSGLRLF